MRINRCKLGVALSFIIYHLSFSPAGAQAPAFPGAEGHGRYVTGGRSSVDGSTKVYHVTNLQDDKNGNIQGSLRWALKQAGPRTIVFDVGGVIPLVADLKINTNTTIAGQTAPAPGITLRYYTVQPNGNNIIVRFIRVRRGQEKNVNDSADAIWTRERTGIILDHCSFSWSIDEVASFYDNNNFTMQWCTIAESLVNAGHDKGAHGYGGIWGGKLASFHHNLIAHVYNRSPRFCGARYQWSGFKNNLKFQDYNWANYVQAENVDFRNCVIYNCKNGCYGGPGGGQINMVKNFYKTGPAGSTSLITKVTVGASGNSTPAALTGMTSRYFLDGNQINNNANAGWSNMSYDGGTITVNGERYSKDPGNFYGAGIENFPYYEQDGVKYVPIKMTEPAPTGEVTTHTAQNAFNKVLKYAGASLNSDEVDLRYFKEAIDGTSTYMGAKVKTKGWIDLVQDLNNGEPYYTPESIGMTNRPEGFDTDQDGMPDAWETANGLNPNDAADANAYTLDSEKKWYSNIEVYLSSLVQDVMKNGNADAETAVDEYYPACKQVELPYVSGIEGVKYGNGAQTMQTTYFDLQGRRLEAPQSGIMIRVEQLSNGKRIVSKVIK